MIEALRFHKPVIAVDVEPYNEVVENGETGLLIPCKKVVQHRYMDRFLFPLHTYSVDALADAIIETLSDKKIYRNMANKCAGVKEKFDAENTYSKIINFF